MSSFLLDNKSFTVDLAADGNTADLIQTNTVPFTAEQLDNAKSKNYYNQTENTISWSHINDANLKGQNYMSNLGAIDGDFSKIINDSTSKSILHQALGTKSSNEGTSQDNNFLATSQVEEDGVSNPNSSSSRGKYFFAYYPLAESGLYDYLQVVCQEYKEDETLTKLGAYNADLTNKLKNTKKEKINKFNVTQVKRATSRSAGAKIMGIIQLPMTGGLSESNNVEWGGSDLNALQIAGAKIAGQTIRSAGNLDVSGLQDLIKGIGEGGKQLVDGITNDQLVSYFAGQAVGVGGNLLNRSSGVALNNNLELLFKAPQLRSFAYAYNFTPRSAEEATMVKNIIWFFKKQMRPKLQKQGIFLKTPNVWKLKYTFNGGQEHPFLNKIKQCALTGVDVDYGGGQYMTYDNGSMTQYQLRLTFSELDPIYYDDYGDTPGSYNDEAWEVYE